MVLNFYQGFCWFYKDSWNWNFFLRWCNSIPETGGNWIKKFIFGCLFSAFRIKTYSCQVIFIVKVIYWRSYRHIYFSLKFFCFFTIFKVVYTKNLYLSFLYLLLCVFIMFLLKMSAFMCLGKCLVHKLDEYEK